MSLKTVIPNGIKPWYLIPLIPNGINGIKLPSSSPLIPFGNRNRDGATTLNFDAIKI